MRSKTFKAITAYIEAATQAVVKPDNLVDQVDVNKLLEASNALLLAIAEEVVEE